jgi:hypothetical protein
MDIISSRIRVSADSLIDPLVLSDILGERILTVQVTDLSGSGGLNATMVRLMLVTASNETRTLVMKSFPVAQWERNRKLGLSREAIFYSHFAPELTNMLPRVVYSFGDMSTGEKTILFEDLTDCVQAGYFCGPYSPHNWGKDLEKLTERCPDFDVVSITDKAFTLAAEFHGRYWMNTNLLELLWLRGSDWLRDDEGCIDLFCSLPVPPN